MKGKTAQIRYPAVSLTLSKALRVMRTLRLARGQELLEPGRGWTLPQRQAVNVHEVERLANQAARSESAMLHSWQQMTSRAESDQQFLLSRT